MNPSTAQARVMVDELVRCGVRHVVLCPGSRNAPLSLALFDAASAGRLTLHVRVDERSAAFLALGIGAVSGRPAAVVCTSGTAAANFHPAVAEADRGCVPLIVLTADRPPALRAAGANQVIEQRRLYGPAVRFFDELSVASPAAGQNPYWRSVVCRAWTVACGPRPGPVHLNVPFDEPLVPDGGDDWCEPLDGRSDGGPWSEFGLTATNSSYAPETDRGLVLACDSDVDGASAWASEHGWPLVAETGTVGLTAGAWLLGAAEFVAAHRPEQVVCFGRPTVFRQFARLLADSDVVLVDPAGRWPTPGPAVRRVVGGLDAPVKPADPGWLAAWERADAAAGAAVAATVRWPSGHAVAGGLLDAVPTGALIVVGSSNAARDLALGPHRQRLDLRILRNRGAAGIDGTVSTAIGGALAHGGPAYAFMGDLTFLHDIGGLLIGPSEPRPPLTVVVMNDDGGGIFETLEQGAPAHRRAFERVFGTPHGAGIVDLCRGYGVPHRLVADLEELAQALAPARELNVVEVRVDRASRRAEHERLRAAVDKALSAHRRK